MVIKKKKLLLFLFSLIPIFYQFFNLEAFQTNFVSYLPLILLVLVGLPLTDLKKLVRGNWMIILPVFINFILIPLISFNLGNFDLSTEVLNICLQILLLLVILIIVSVVKDTDTLLSLLKITLISNSIILTIAIVSNFNEVTNINNYMWIVYERLDRAVYGFGHSNTAASFIFIELILLILVYLLYKKKILLLPILFFIPPLVATGSRTAIIGLMIFITVYIIFRFIGKFNVNIKLLLLAFVSILLFLSILNFNWDFLWESSSGRDVRFIYNINYLLENNLFWFGIGPINNTSISSLVPQIYTIDNWYLNNTILYGIFGTISFLVTAVWIVYKYLKHTFYVRNTQIVVWGLSFLISFLIYSFFETFLYTPGVLASIIFWIFILAIIKNKDEINDMNILNKKKKGKRYRLTW